MLRDDFVIGWNNIERESYCGSSRGYSRTQTAIGTSNGAGGNNVQIFVMTPDLVVLNALPGFWHPEDLANELKFSKVLDRLWRDEQRTSAQKNDMWAKLRQRHLRTQSAATTARSGWQGFDERRELARAQRENLDTVVIGDDGPEVKPLNRVVHERMMTRPFVAFADFDVESFVDYGLTHYDNNGRYDEHAKRFRRSELMHRKRAATEMRERLAIAAARR